jgi:two-component system response regulator FixJ
MPDDSQETAYIVDDEPAVRASLGLLVRGEGFSTREFETGDSFLEAADAGLQFGCVLLDLRMPGRDGLAVQSHMRARRIRLPVVIITAHGDIPLAVRAMKEGVCDFVEKPYTGEMILRAARAAWSQGAEECARAMEADAAAEQLATLSPRELDVLRGLLAGLSNKVVAFDLGISPRTVEVHRANVMAKLGTRSLSGAVRIALAGGLV